MSSFYDAIEEIIDTLTTGHASSYAREAWGKELNIRAVYKKRTEIALSDLPIIMVTRPEVNPEAWTIGERNNVQTLRLYYGFIQNDKALAQEQSIKFEEAIDDDLLLYKETPAMLPDNVIDIEAGIAVNDEGEYHPVYFGVKEVKVDYIRQL